MAWNFEISCSRLGNPPEGNLYSDIVLLFGGIAGSSFPAWTELPTSLGTVLTLQ